MRERGARTFACVEDFVESRPHAQVEIRGDDLCGETGSRSYLSHLVAEIRGSKKLFRRARMLREIQKPLAVSIIFRRERVRHVTGKSPAGEYPPRLARERGATEMMR